jgi:hypothetical protein
MLSKRVIVIAADKPFQKRLIAGAMAAGGAVQAFASSEELPGRIEADLVLYSMGWSIADPAFTGLLARLPEGARLVPILPAPQLEGMVSLLIDPRISTVLVAEEMSAQTVSSAVSKLLYGDLFGLEKVMPWGVRIYSMLVGDYQEKSLAIATIGDFASAMGVRRKYREQIDQCIDEMLMNALYDAPVDDDGKPLFAEVPVKERVGLKVSEKAVVQYACDGERFAVSVRDSFGSLQKTTVLQYLDKCLHASGPEQIDRKAGGAGLGLYLIANAATEIYFHIFEDRATEVVCTFDLAAARSQLRSFGIFQETLATAARPQFGPGSSGIRTLPTRQGRRREDIAPLPPRQSVLLPVMMTFAVLLLITAVTLVALPYVRHAPLASLRVETDPPGATVFIDGRTRGNSPIKVDGLEAGRSYAVRSTMTGHQDDDQLVVAADGESTVRLRLQALAGVVAIESDPPGAHVILDGKETGKLAPATLELSSGKNAEITLRKDGFLEQKLQVTGPGAGERRVYTASLPLSREVAALTIETEPAGATVTVDGMALMPPQKEHDTFVKPQSLHHVKITAPGFIDFREDVTLSGGEHKTIRARLGEGGVLALKTNVVARVFIDDKAVGTAPLAPLALAEGKHTLALKAEKPYLRYTSTVTVEKGKTLEQKLDFGTVEVKAPGVTATLQGAHEGVTMLQLPAGPQKLALSNKDGETREREIVIAPGGKLVIDAW